MDSESRWKLISQKTATPGRLEEMPSMVTFYWSHVTRHLVKLLHNVKKEINVHWGTRNPSARWRLVKSTMKGILLHKLSKAKMLYRNCSHL